MSSKTQMRGVVLDKIETSPQENIHPCPCEHIHPCQDRNQPSGEYPPLPALWDLDQSKESGGHEDKTGDRPDANSSSVHTHISNILVPLELRFKQISITGLVSFSKPAAGDKSQFAVETLIFLPILSDHQRPCCRCTKAV